MKIALAQLNPTVGDLSGNLEKILEQIRRSKDSGAELVLFPELAVTGYPPEDFLLLDHFIDCCERSLASIREASHGIAVVVGVPRRNPDREEKGLYNSAAVFSNGELLGYTDKCLLPTYDVFDERRYFEPGCKPRIWELGGQKVGITICEDIWQHGGKLRHVSYRQDPVEGFRDLSPDLILNLSSSPFHVDKQLRRIEACQSVAQSLSCPVIMCNQVGGNDSLIFDGHSLWVDEKAQVQEVAKGFEEDWVLVDTSRQRSDSWTSEGEPIGGLYNALVLGLRDYFRKLGFKKACLGLSGGIDSAVVACLAADAIGADNLLALSMPSRFSSDHSLNDAEVLAKKLGCDYKVISIEPCFQQYLDLLQPHFEGRPMDVTEENLQARVRGMILMAFSNKLGYIVLSPGNKSEIALGYCTLYGDTCGGLGVINDVVKTRVYALARWINREREIIPNSIITKPPSAELRPDQKDTDSLPEYEVVDAILMDYVEKHLSPKKIAETRGYDLALVQEMVRKIHANEYKRVQMPPGLRVTERAFSKGRNFPIVQRWV